MDYLCTWIYLDSPEESSEYPQVGSESHQEGFQWTYWQCVAVFFALSTRFNPGCTHLLFSNKKLEEFPNIRGFDLQKHLHDANVKVITLPLTWQTPPGYFGKWRNQFYIFDMLKFIESNYFDDTDAFVVLDSDCLVNHSLNDLFVDLRAQGLLALAMPYEPEHNINGVTRQQMRHIYTTLDGGRDPGHDPVYYGGEIFAATLPIVRRINTIAPYVWKEMIGRFQEKQPKLNEEAHFLSYCYYKIGRFGTLLPYIKRIWTAPHYNNVTSSDADLPIWHLPSEKTGGIALLFKKFIARNRALPTNLGDFVGIPYRRYYLNWKHFLKYTLIYKFFKKLSA